MIKYLVMDVDGTLTDGKIYMGSHGEIMKAFSVKDGYVIRYLLEPRGIIPIVITARKSEIVEKRCVELGIQKVYQGVTDKYSLLKQIIEEKELFQCVYFGDDILDLDCMRPIKKAGGIIGCPSDAVSDVKAIADYVCLHKAGEGALREFTEWFINFDRKKEFSNRIDNAISYLTSLNIVGKEIGKRYVVDEYFYYTIQKYTTQPAATCRLESHRQNVDIQLIYKGKEAIDLVDIARLTQVEQDYNEKIDVMFWKVPEKMARITLQEGDYVVLYPENAHRATISIGKPEEVIKIVGKVRS